MDDEPVSRTAFDGRTGEEIIDEVDLFLDSIWSAYRGCDVPVMDEGFGWAVHMIFSVEDDSEGWVFDVRVGERRRKELWCFEL